MTRLIVLGIDALDIELCKEFGVEKAFGSHYKKIDTYANPVVDAPHTRELWPSLITGLHPDEHGIHAVTDSKGVEWGNPLLNYASTLGNAVIPHSVMAKAGKLLRERGAGLDSKDVGYYESREINTVFTGRNYRAISIPNYLTEYDQTHEFDANRDWIWRELLVEREPDSYEPSIPLNQVYGVLQEAFGKRAAHLEASLFQNHELIWVWFGVLDTVGHIDPAISEPMQENWYRIVANYVSGLKKRVDDDTEILVVSDHGLQDGSHTEYASLASESSDAIAEIESVFDVADWIDGKELYSAKQAQDTQTASLDEMKGDLKELGYIE